MTIQQITADEIDDTPYGRYGDHCPWCGRDWKQEHDRDCREFRQCQYPPGCDHDSACGRNACLPHFILVSAMFGQNNFSQTSIDWANAQIAKREQK